MVLGLVKLKLNGSSSWRDERYEILNEKVTLTSSMTEDNHIEMDSLVDAILDSMKDK